MRRFVEKIVAPEDVDITMEILGIYAVGSSIYLSMVTPVIIICWCCILWGW